MSNALHRLARQLGAARREELAQAYAEAFVHLRAVGDHRAARFYSSLSALLLSDVERAAADMGRTARETLSDAIAEGAQRVEDAGDGALSAWKREVVDLLRGTTDAEDAVVWHTRQQLEGDAA